jgi:hypothetical protein
MERRVILNGSSGSGGIYWIALAQGRDNWQVVLDAVMKFRVP